MRLITPASLPKGCYVYLLASPFTGLVFYVGKGTGHRCFDHESDVRGGRGGNNAKAVAIQHIVDRGGSPICLCVAEGLSDHTALMLEHSIIQAKAKQLTNANSGQRSYAGRELMRVRWLMARLYTPEELIATGRSAEDVDLLRELSDNARQIEAMCLREIGDPAYAKECTQLRRANRKRIKEAQKSRIGEWRDLEKRTGLKLLVA